MNENLIIGRCNGCKYARVIGTNPIGWRFVGCFCKPFKGKWTREIKECPKEQKERENND